MIRKGVCLVFLVTGLMLLSGCMDTKSEVIEIEEVVTIAETPEPTSLLPTPSKTSQAVSKIMTKSTLSQTPVAEPGSPKFNWGDIIEAPNGTRYILLEGNPDISGIYPVYKIIKCPCVQLLFLDVGDTDEECIKVGTKNPMTICNDSALTILKEPGDVCNIVEPDSLSGYGDARKSLSVPYDGRFSIMGSHSGENEFVVKISGNNGRVTQYLFNAIGVYSGAEVVYLEKGRYTITVQASGSWKIDITTI